MKELQRMIERKCKEKKKKENRSLDNGVCPCLANWRVCLECEVWMKKRWEIFVLMGEWKWKKKGNKE